MDDDFGIGLGREFDALPFKLPPQFAEVFDDAIVHHGDLFGGVWMRVVFGRAAMGRPTRVANTDGAFERLAFQPALEVLQLSLGAPARELAAFERSNARGIIAAIFEALERIDELRRRRLAANDPDNSTHTRYQIS